MVDGYKTKDLQFAAVLAYIYTQESIIEIELINYTPHLTLDIPSLDAEEYLKEFQAGTLACADCQAMFKAYGRILGAVRDATEETREVDEPGIPIGMGQWGLAGWKKDKVGRNHGAIRQHCRTRSRP